MTDSYQEIQKLIDSADHIVVIQADNPDGDSLGSALALEDALSEAGKKVSPFCAVDIPAYSKYAEGWSRVSSELPAAFDLSIIVDASTVTLLEKLDQSGGIKRLRTKPCVVIDHHKIVEKPIDFATVTICNPEVASTGEINFHCASELKWTFTIQGCTALMISILGDTQGLTNDLTKASTYDVMSELVRRGVNRPELEEVRRQYSRMPQSIYAYKGRLLARTNFLENGAVALVHVPQEEINEFSPLYNPAALVQFDMLQVVGVKIAVVIKSYDDGKITGAIRTAYGFPYAGIIAEGLGGGGHPYASGFKISSGSTYTDARNKLLALSRTSLSK